MQLSRSVPVPVYVFSVCCVYGIQGLYTLGLVALHIVGADTVGLFTSFGTRIREASVPQCVPGVVWVVSTVVRMCVGLVSCMHRARIGFPPFRFPLLSPCQAQERPVSM